LRNIASITGGKYFRAENTEGLREIYHEIDAMEKYLISTQNVTRRQELFVPIGFVVLLLILLELLLKRTVFRSIP
jgi:Ca-activated chloride channel family protein